MNIIILSSKMKGEFIYGKGNRVSFLCFGPQNVLILAGLNKVVTDIESGFKRIHDIASPPNAVTRRSGIPHRIKVILIGEELGY